MPLHKLLLRQLNKEGFSEDSLPENLQQWHHFIGRVNNSYEEVDRERYLLERSMEISSRELLELNEKLEDAQHLAKLGYWSFDRDENKLVLSSELYEFFGLDRAVGAPLWEDFLRMIHEKDYASFVELSEKALTEGGSYECEIQIQFMNDKYHWFYIAMHAVPRKESNSYVLSGIAMDVTRRKEAEEEASLQKHLLTLARRAGMADVATAMLHNVGNILNSANVSVNLVQEHLQEPYYKKLFLIGNMFKEHISSIANYLTEDPKGKLIPNYFIAMVDMIEKNYVEVCNEISALSKHVGHVKEIIAMQQTLGSVSGIKDKIFLPEAVDTALLMSVSGSSVNDLAIDKDYRETPFVVTDKIKLLQILVNLIQNAKESMREQEGAGKRILLSIKKGETDDQVKVVVADQGGGIKVEDMTKIFTFGFTTKKNGHGFGLHSSALAAKEIGGTLTAESDGAGFGAIFTLTLPARDEIRSSDNATAS